MIEKTLFAILSEMSTPSYPLVIPQEQKPPAIDYFRLKTLPTNTIKGTNRLVDNGHFQIDIWGSTYFEAKELAEDVIDNLISVYAANALLLEMRDDYEVDPGTYHIILVFSLRENRSEGGS